MVTYDWQRVFVGLGILGQVLPFKRSSNKEVAWLEDNTVHT